ncbi:unnamed protein product [Rangifer tarandus platyrhynchus]|uniref:Uncharacterized protein n=2 Tax=Rangifer tarandus platyrhynchus TaxID=3082113 RepID=A0ABN8ZIX6_RANTA|nr:unnamed protein product [Rangifer tarandus platyrhynchus]CAI9708319.1 unnamed protein product [Rangifer tarandus platyrhynchus]
MPRMHGPLCFLESALGVERGAGGLRKRPGNKEKMKASRKERSGRKGGGTQRSDAETGAQAHGTRAGPGRADAAQGRPLPSGVPRGGARPPHGPPPALLSVLLLDGITGTSSPCAVSPSSHQAPGILGVKGGQAAGCLHPLVLPAQPRRGCQGPRNNPGSAWSGTGEVIQTLSPRAWKPLSPAEKSWTRRLVTAEEAAAAAGRLSGRCWASQGAAGLLSHVTTWAFLISVAAL